LTKTIAITDGQWRYMHRKISVLTDKVLELARLVERAEAPKRYLKFNEALPPASVCRDVVSMLPGVGNYEGFIGRLADYYHCVPMGLYIDATIEPKYKALYRSWNNAAYTREKTCERHTVLHEFFHHLIAQHVVVVSPDQVEHFADQYATVFLQRAREVREE